LDFLEEIDITIDQTVNSTRANIPVIDDIDDFDK
jgi:hypothetical protein